MRTRTLVIVTSLLAIAVLATGTVAVLQTERAAHERDRAAELEDEVDLLRDEVASLRDELEAARQEGGPEGVSPDDGGDDEAGLDLGGMLDDLLGGSIPGQECLTPEDGGLSGLLDGLLGGSSSLPDEPDEIVRVIADQVAELRELEWQEPVDAEFLTSAELHERLEEILDEDLEPDAIEASERLLVTLGAIPPDADLEQLQRDLLDDQVAGYYSPETGELVVRVPDDGELRPVDLVTLAHELDHALADQTLGIPDRSEPPFVDDADAALAVLAVVEGDATLLMNVWALTELSLGDQLAMATDPSIIAAQSAMDDVPHLLQRELLFPYTEGLDWVCQVYLDGGWAAVDAAYADPPATTAEVLWGEPIEPAGTASMTSPDGFDELQSTTLGAAPLQWLLEAPGGDPDRALDDPQGRARAWGGGDVTIWARGADTAIGLALVDGGAGTEPLCATVRAWYESAFPAATATRDGDATRFDGDVAGLLRCDGDDVVLSIAPDAEVAATIVG